MEDKMNWLKKIVEWFKSLKAKKKEIEGWGISDLLKNDKDTKKEQPATVLKEEIQILDGIPENIKWIQYDILSFPVTSTLDVTLHTDSIVLDYDKAEAWKPIYTENDPLAKPVCANAWIIFFSPKDNSYIGASWEWLRPGQKIKEKSAVCGDHFPCDGYEDYKPYIGEKVGFIVSTCKRHTTHAEVDERTDVCWVTWR